MLQQIFIKYLHPVYNIGVEDIRNIWLLNQPPVKLPVSSYRGSLVYRLPSSGKRISYRILKKGLIKKNIVIRLPVKLLPF